MTPPPPVAERQNVVQVFHLNLNCSSLERSQKFYESIGFRVVNSFEAAGPVRSFADIGLAPILRLPADCDARAVLLALTDHPHTTRLDLIEWIRPSSETVPKGDLSRIGFGRLCLKVRDCAALHQRLVDDGRIVYSEPIQIEMGGSRQFVFCCEDPDGIVIEFMQFVR